MLTLADCYDKLPSGFIKKALRKIWNLYRSMRHKRTVVVTVDGITYELDLRERIDSSIYYRGYFEKDTTEVFNKFCKKGMTVLDIIRVGL